MCRAGLRTGNVITTSFPFRFWRISIGDCSIAYGVPKKWHHLVAAISRLYCTLRSSAAISGVSEAGGTFLLSNHSSQTPERLFAPGPLSLLRVKDCAALV